MSEKFQEPIKDEFPNDTLIPEKNPTSFLHKVGEVIKRTDFEARLPTIITTTESWVESIMRFKRPEGIPFEKNASRRSYLEIIKDGVERFKQETGSDVKVNQQAQLGLWGLTKAAFQEVESIPNFENYRRVDVQIGKSPLERFAEYGFQPEILTTNLIAVLPEKYGKAIAEANGGMVSYLKLDIQERRDRFEVTKKIIEDLVAENNERPVSTSYLISYYLSQFEGDISRALDETAVFLKMTARETPDGPEWICKNILDEFSTYTPYHKLNTEKEATGTNTSGEETILYNFSYKNQAGLPYHTAHITALLRVFSPHLIYVMTNAEYLQHGLAQGSRKFLSDMKTVSELFRIQDYLNQFS